MNLKDAVSRVEKSISLMGVSVDGSKSATESTLGPPVRPEEAHLACSALGGVTGQKKLKIIDHDVWLGMPFYMRTLHLKEFSSLTRNEHDEVRFYADIDTHEIISESEAVRLNQVLSGEETPISRASDTTEPLISDLSQQGDESSLSADHSFPPIASKTDAMQTPIEEDIDPDFQNMDEVQDDKNKKKSVSTGVTPSLKEKYVVNQSTSSTTYRQPV